jgi:hypothetical protein
VLRTVCIPWGCKACHPSAAAAAIALHITRHIPSIPSTHALSLLRIAAADFFTTVVHMRFALLVPAMFLIYFGTFVSWAVVYYITWRCVPVADPLPWPWEQSWCLLTALSS